MLHDTFDARQEGDYKEFVELPSKEATEYAKLSKEFLESIKRFINAV